MVVLCGLLLSATACSRREPTDPDAEEWKDIQALADDAGIVSALPEPEPEQRPQSGEPVPEGQFDEFIQRLEQMKSVRRQAGEMLLTGKTLNFDYDERFVRMDDQVRVVDDHGILETESLLGRFSASNQVETIEAGGGVVITGDERTARSETAVYDYLSGMVELAGPATVSARGNRLSGERIRLWTKGDRKMVCEPNALLEVSGISGAGMDNLPAGDTITEIRADRVIYNENEQSAQLDGSVRLRDPRIAMNCSEARVYLKDDNKIDWIEALHEVIIQSGDRKALAERATYHANDGKFTLEGDPKVMQGLNIMTGDRIMFWHETRRMVCEPNARALLYLDEETEAKFLEDLND
jgi:lipopolysaccharide export system protein LptA